MFNLPKTTVVAGIIALAAIGSATPAMAVHCSAGGKISVTLDESKAQNGVGENPGIGA